MEITIVILEILITLVLMLKLYHGSFTYIIPKLKKYIVSPNTAKTFKRNSKFGVFAIILVNVILTIWSVKLIIYLIISL
jgi:hypothetical protein